MDLATDEWLATLRREYLADFIPAGGAAVKFAVPGPGVDREQLRQDLRTVATGAGCAFALVDAAQTRVHLIDQVFHAVARQLDWPALAHRFLAAVLREHGWHLPPEADELTLTRLASLNGRLADLARNERRRPTGASRPAERPSRWPLHAGQGRLHRPREASGQDRQSL